MAETDSTPSAGEAQGESQTVTLRKPIFAEGVKMNAVTIEPLTIGQQFDARRKHPNDVAEQERLLIAYAAGVALTVGILAYYRALAAGPVSVVVPIYGLFIVVSSLVGIVAFDEAVTPRKVAAIALSVVAIALMSI